MKKRKLNPEGESFEATKTVETTTRCTFADLPREIWHEISSHLELVDKAALTLTCRSSLACFGADVVRSLSLPTQRMERLKLLFRLLHRFPGHYLCAECCLYHLTIKKAKSEAKDIVLDGFSAAFRLKWNVMASIAADLRKAMGTADDAAKRIGLNVCVALMEQRFIISLASVILLTTHTLQLGTNRTFRACRHSPSSSTLMRQVDKAISRAPRPWEPAQAYTYSSPVLRCPYCPTEFTLYSAPIGHCS